MYGVVTRNREEVDWPEFDRGFYEVRDVTGRTAEPLPNAVNMIPCLGDNVVASENPELVPVDGKGNPVVCSRMYFDWAYTCPINEKCRAGPFETVEDVAAVNGDVRLDDVDSPRDEYCRCERRTLQSEAWTADRGRDIGNEEAWFEWRVDVIIDFVADVVERVPGRLYLTLYPDSYPGHLCHRVGLDIEALSTHVDEFVVPLYDTNHGTTYWLETIAHSFASSLESYDVDFSLELYAVNVDVDDLIHVIEVADEYAKDVLLGYDASNAVATLRRTTVDGPRGKTYHPDDVTR